MRIFGSRASASSVLASLLAAALGAVSCGCAGEVLVLSGSGGDSTGDATTSTATGPTSEAPRDIELAFWLQSEDWTDYDASRLLVMVNHVDGSLAQSWFGGELPVQATVVDGDLVTYASVDPLSLPSQSVTSYRVSPGVKRIAHRMTGAGSPSCADQTMHVDVHLIDLPGAKVAYVVGGGAYETTYELSAGLGLDVWSCGKPSVSLVCYVVGPMGYLGFEAVDLPFEAGTSISYTPSFASIPRKTLAFDVDGLEGAKQAGAYAFWLQHDGGGLLITNDPELEMTQQLGDAPFHFEADIVDFPGYGVPFAGGSAELPLTDGACDHRLGFSRIGASDAVLAFHLDLAEPSLDGDGWKLGASGVAGDVLLRTFDLSAGQSWTLFEDARTMVYPAVLPSFPAVVPTGFVAPHDSPTPWYLENIDDEELTSYADFVARSEVALVQTRTSHGNTYVCDP